MIFENSFYLISLLLYGHQEGYIETRQCPYNGQNKTIQYRLVESMLIQDAPTDKFNSPSDKFNTSTGKFTTLYIDKKNLKKESQKEENIPAHEEKTFQVKKETVKPIIQNQPVPSQKKAVGEKSVPPVVVCNNSKETNHYDAPEGNWKIGQAVDPSFIEWMAKRWVVLDK